MNAPTRPLETAVLSTAPDRPDYQLAPSYVGGQDLILHGDYFEKIDKLAVIMSKAKGAVPRYLLGNSSACFSIALTAVRANFDPFGVARKTWEGPDGTIKYEGQLVIALINNSGLLKDRLRWEYFGPWEKILGKFQWRESKKKQDEHGDAKKYIVKAWNEADEVGLGVRCIGHLKGEAEPRVTELLMAQAVIRNSTLWVEDPKQQIGYLSGARWGRLHTPEATMGVYTPEEFDGPIKDMGAADEVTIPKELIARGQQAADQGMAAYQAFWKASTHLERAQLDDQSDWHDKFKQRAHEVDKGRTVDAPKTTGAPAPTPAPSTPAATPAPTPDPATGEVPPPAEASAFVATFASVAGVLKKAFDEKNPVALEIAADWVDEVKDKQHQEELGKLYVQYRAELGMPPLEGSAA